tara:strand:- start:1866 stop:2567 length:702 start_codon:yes stop_codon:yes gene_type:complete
MQHLPNLGRLDLRLRSKTGANQDGDDDDDFDFDYDNDADARRVRPRVALLNLEQQSRIRRFLDDAVRGYMGLDATDPPPSETEKDQVIAEAKSEVAQMYADLSDDWPDKLGTEEGLGMFPAGRQPIGETLVTQLIRLWTDGFGALYAKRRSNSQEMYDYEQIKQSMKETERKEVDAVDDNGYFEERMPDSDDVPPVDPELKAELDKKVARGDEKRWAQEGHRDRCCTGAWGRL